MVIMNPKPKERPEFKSIQIDDKDGLNISYNKKEIIKNLPHIADEITKHDNMIKINSVEYEIEEVEKEEKDLSNLEELIDPSVLDFIRRCTTNKDAIEILDYLLKREEISKDLFNSYKKEIEKKDGLKNLIKRSGGFKNSGYYLRKYYFQNQDKKKKY
ncbi:MAG: DUF2095 family protein [Candidatus Lokiarchaeota archaeon]|nr:DUF2095 family protein [Candidatus Lokiarchaeota archaeon]